MNLTAAMTKAGNINSIKIPIQKKNEKID